MHVRRSSGAKGSLFFPALVFLWCLLGGCGTALIPLDGSAIRRPDLPPVQSLVYEQGSPNDEFAGAQPVTLPDAGEVDVEGTIDGKGDVDIFALGPVIVGDRITIDVSGHDGLNTVAALFDGDQSLIDANDDRSYYSGQLDPFLEVTVRNDTGNLFVGIAVSRAGYFASDAGRYDSGSYSIHVRREPGASAAPAMPQVVWLDFEGGATVQIAQEPAVQMRAFSAESISSRLNGQTDTIVSLLVDNMRRDFADYNVVLLDSKHNSRPAAPYSTLYFGNFNANFLGLADNVDTDNKSLSQEAIIYTEDLKLYDSLTPSVEEEAQALANIASHELGHLLGLNHTAESTDLMAPAASARQIFENDLTFTRSRLLSAVFPVGWQDDSATLLLNVGTSPGGAGARVRFSDVTPQPATNWRDEAGMQDMPLLPCGGH